MLSHSPDTHTTHTHEEEGWSNATSLVSDVKREISWRPALKCVFYRWLRWVVLGSYLRKPNGSKPKNNGACAGISL